MEATAMMRMRTGVLTVAAAAFGFVAFGAVARGGDPDPLEVKAVAAIQRAGGWVSPAFLFYPQACVVVIEGDKVTDGDLIHLGQLKNMSVLSLDRAKVTDAGMAHVASSKNLKVLSLEDTQVTDAGLAHLKPLKKLRELDLKGAPVGDAGLDHISELKRLRKLTVVNTQVSAEGVARLRRSLPWCRILSGDDPVRR
jgi:Leucine Rich repeat